MSAALARFSEGSPTSGRQATGPRVASIFERTMRFRRPHICVMLPVYRFLWLQYDSKRQKSSDILDSDLEWYLNGRILVMLI